MYILSEKNAKRSGDRFEWRVVNMTFTKETEVQVWFEKCNFLGIDKSSS